MAFDALPGTACRDRHLLVVVARGATRGTGITQPVAVLDGNRVGDVRKGSRSLVGGYDEVGIVSIATDDTGRRHNLAADDVVSQIEQTADQSLVAGDDFRLHLFASSIRKPLADETTLGADGNDDRVFYVLCLHQAQNLRPEVFAPVGPAYATARNITHAQVHGLHAGAVYKHLELRTGQRQVGDLRRIQLDRQVALRLLIDELVVVGADRGLDYVQVAAQDAILVRARHGIQIGADLTDQLVGVAFVGDDVRIEPALEQAHQVACDRRIARQRSFHGRLAEGDA